MGRGLGRFGVGCGEVWIGRKEGSDKVEWGFTIRGYEERFWGIGVIWSYLGFGGYLGFYGNG